MTTEMLFANPPVTYFSHRYTPPLTKGNAPIDPVGPPNPRTTDAPQSCALEDA